MGHSGLNFILLVVLYIFGVWALIDNPRKNITWTMPKHNWGLFPVLIKTWNVKHSQNQHYDRTKLNCFFSWKHANEKTSQTILWWHCMLQKECHEYWLSTVDNIEYWLSYLVHVGGVNTTADKTRQFCLISNHFPICKCSLGLQKHWHSRNLWRHAC